MVCGGGGGGLFRNHRFSSVGKYAMITDTITVSLMSINDFEGMLWVHPSLDRQCVYIH